MPGVVLVFEDDLLFASRVEMGLRAKGFHPCFVTRVEELGEALNAAPVLILLSIGTIIIRALGSTTRAIIGIALLGAGEGRWWISA